MKRNLKFRGKSIISGDWIYGCLFINDDKRTFIVHELITKEVYYSEITPESIGQFTGFTDVNGNDIYEKQKCKFKDIVGSIEWEQQAGAFWLKWNSKSESGRIFHRYKDLTATFSDGIIFQCDYLEIVGDVVYGCR